tara:strand:+ start:81 stop:284 length:204 start_codon:yes stop_codon:yes gene_type:complete
MINNILPVDYLSSRNDSLKLARKIEEYYHKQGHTSVKASVLREEVSPDNYVWVIRSNLKFKVPRLSP